MKLQALIVRNTKEIIRDPLNIAFGIGFPLVVLLLLSAISANVPVPLFEISHLTPGITVFGLSFITLFSGMIVAKDRSTALLQRLYTTPLTAWEYILGYMIPFVPIALIQGTVCYLVAFCLQLECSVGVVYALLGGIPVSLLYIAIGLLFGSILTEKQVGGVCGALLTNLSAWLSGTWFDLQLVGDTFNKIANCLPFVHAVEFERALLSGSGDGWVHLLWVLGYAIVLLVLAVVLFVRQMKRQ